MLRLYSRFYLALLASLAMFVYGLNLQIPVWPSFITR